MLLLWLGPPLLAALISALFDAGFPRPHPVGDLVPAYLAIAGAIARSDDARERRIIACCICITLVPTALASPTRPRRSAGTAFGLSNAQREAHDQSGSIPPIARCRSTRSAGRCPELYERSRSRFPPWASRARSAPARRRSFPLPGTGRDLCNDPEARARPGCLAGHAPEWHFRPYNDMPTRLPGRAGPGRAEWGYIKSRLITAARPFRFRSIASKLEWFSSSSILRRRTKFDEEASVRRSRRACGCDRSRCRAARSADAARRCSWRAPPPPASLLPRRRRSMRMRVMSDRVMTREEVSPMSASSSRSSTPTTTALLRGRRSKPSPNSCREKMRATADGRRPGENASARWPSAGPFSGDARPAAIFDRLDTNHDGNISRQEFMAAKTEIPRATNDGH